MPNIIVTTTPELWNQAQKKGMYTNSTITTMLAEVGFIHCTTPEQVINMVNRHFADYDNLLLLVVDTDKITSKVIFEAALSGRPGLFPHIYGPLNIDAVTETIELRKESDKFAPSKRLSQL